MKSRLGLFEKLSEKVKALHSYELPEIIAIPIIKGFDAYLEWLNNFLRESFIFFMTEYRGSNAPQF